tara:strand:+ start:15916 stop:17310 length:1395 start_codon:yes stop_codon:yes gene_type:complete
MAQNKTTLLKDLLKKNRFNIAINDIENDRQYKVYDLLKKIKKIQSFFKKKNLKKNDLILVDLPNSIEFIAIYFACIFSKISIVPLSKALSEDQKNYIKKFCRPNLILKTNFLQCSNNKINIKRKFNKNYAIFFTSGTTSKPKGVCHTFDNLIDNAIVFNNFTHIKKKLNFLHFLPMGYMAGFLNSILCPLLAESNLFLIKNYNINTSMKFFELLKNYKINYFWATPSLIDFLNKLSCNKNLLKKVKSNLKMIFVGTAPFPKKLNNDFYKKLKVKCLESYGSTEQLLISTNSTNFKIYKSGKILPSIKYELTNQNEIIINSRFTFDGYLKKYNEVEIRKSKIFETGDLAKVNQKNYLEIIGRKKNIIIKNGINYSPKYYEEKIENFKSVNRAIVLGVNDKSLNQKIFVIIEPKNKINLQFIKNKIEVSFKEIDDVIFLKKIPLTNIGKPDINHLNKIINKYEKKN